MLYKYSSKITFLITVILGVIKSSENVALAYIVGTLINMTTNHRLIQLPRFIAIIVAIFLFLLVVELLFNRLKANLIKNVNVLLRKRIIQGMLNNSSEENKESLGFLTNEFKLLETNRFDAEINAILSIATLVMALSYALYSNWILTTIFFVGSMLPVVVSNIFQKSIQNASTQWTEQNAKYVSQTKNFLQAADTVKLYGKSADVATKNQKSIVNLENALKKMNLVNSNANSYINIIAYIGTFVLPFLVGIYMVLKGQTTLGALMAIVQLTNAFVNPILALLQARNNFSTTKPIIDKVNGYLSNVKVNDNHLSMNNSLVLEDITLSRNQNKLLSHLTVNLNKGEKIAIIGPSGSGKSTLLNFMVTDDKNIGNIKKVLLDGKEKSLSDVSSIFAYASQHPVIFADSLWFNLTLGENIPKQRVEEVCNSLDLTQIIEEKGFDYELGGEVAGLSGGQLARIELARAILSNRPILLLDEINASLDSKTDKDVHEYLQNSNLTFLEVIHHYTPDDLKQYDAIIDVGEFK